MKLAAAVVVVFLFFAGAVAGSYALSLTAIENSQHQWCDTLTLLTARPVPKPADPKANPSREQNYQFYETLVHLRDRFGC